MNLINKRIARKKQRGAMLVMIAVTMIILFIAAAFCVDIAYMHMVRAELRTVCDASARAGAEALSRTQDEDAAIQAAIEIANRNNVAGDEFILTAADIEIGAHEIQPDGTFRFVPGGEPRNAMRVLASKTEGSPSGSVPLFFGPMFGRSTFQPQQTATACQLDRDIALVLDVSGSMGAPGRLSGLINAVLVFLSELAGTEHEELVSLTIYSTNSTKLIPLTRSLGGIGTTVGKFKANGMTAVGLGLRDGIDSVLNDPEARPFAAKTVILMTDGNHNTDVSPLIVADEAAAAGVVVHTITFSGGANQQLMKDVAQKTGGIHLHANNNQQLSDAFKTIALQLPVVLID